MRLPGTEKEDQEWQKRPGVLLMAIRDQVIIMDDLSEFNERLPEWAGDILK